MYNQYKIIYLYLPYYKRYVKLNPPDLSVIISNLFSQLALPAMFMSSVYLDNIVNSKVSYLGSPQADIQPHLVAMSNGILDVQTGSLRKASAKRFVVNHLPYSYDPSMATPCFDAYVEHISEGIEDRRRFVMALLKVVILGQPQLHTFFYLYGPGGTGKTILTLLVNALVGDATTHTTTLRALNNDQFEAVNIAYKKLLLIGDTESYSRDVSQLKALTGGDPLRGRVMYSNATEDIDLQGTLVMTGNALLETLDSSGALICEGFVLSRSLKCQNRRNTCYPKIAKGCGQDY